MQSITLKIGGMTCQGCVRSLTNVLSRLPGVASAQVSLENATAEVHYDAAEISVEQMRAAITAAGYAALA